MLKNEKWLSSITIFKLYNNIQAALSRRHKVSYIVS